MLLPKRGNWEDAKLSVLGFKSKKLIQINAEVEKVLERSDKISKKNYWGHFIF